VGEHTAAPRDGRYGRLVRLGVGAGFVAAAGCAWLLVSALGGGAGAQGPQSAGCDRLCAADPSAGTPDGASGPPGGGPPGPPTAGDSRSGQPIAEGSATPPSQVRSTDGGTPAPGQNTASSSPSTPSGQLVRFTVTSHWATGYRMTVTVTNGGTAPITGWTLSFHVTGATLTLPADQPGISETGQTVEWVPGDWQATINPGQSESVGFGFDGALNPPTGCVFDGAGCTFVQQAPQ
jgi:cellulase/cellobiase CelA1